MRQEGYEVYSPTVVCDRIAVRDGAVFFVEFRLPGQSLRPGQARIQSLVPQNYIVRFGDYERIHGERKPKTPSIRSGVRRVYSDETRERMRIASTGRRHTEETKAKIGAALRGRPSPLLGRIVDRAPSPIPHGTRQGYNRGCREECCRATARIAAREWRSRRSAKS